MFLAAFLRKTLGVLQWCLLLVLTALVLLLNWAAWSDVMSTREERTVSRAFANASGWIAGLRAGLVVQNSDEYFRDDALHRSGNVDFRYRWLKGDLLQVVAMQKVSSRMLIFVCDISSRTVAFSSRTSDCRIFLVRLPSEFPWDKEKSEIERQAIAVAQGVWTGLYQVEKDTQPLGATANAPTGDSGH